MRMIDSDSAEAYLRETGRIGPDELVRVRRLSGGVSNEVLHVERGGGAGDFVLKQARRQLRVADPWFCSVERIWREVETLRACAAALERAGGMGTEDDPAENAPSFTVAVPQVLFEDRENYAFAMTAAPPHEVWKARLLAGRVEPAIAAACGRLLAALHAGTWRDPDVAARLGDRSFFDDLRIDPYYRRVAQVHGDLKAPVAALIGSLEENRVCLVQGDFSPKNLLLVGVRPEIGSRQKALARKKHPKKVPPGRRDLQVVLVDFEVGHYGDPAFDLGFFLTHLALKAFWSGPRFGEYFALTEAFWRTYRAGMRGAASSKEIERLTARAVRNFAACMLARIDGKSKVEYLTDEPLRQRIRHDARRLLLDPPETWDAVREQLTQDGGEL